MPTLDRAGGPLDYDVIDITPPWVEDPETIVFCHGVATDRVIEAQQSVLGEQCDGAGGGERLGERCQVEDDVGGHGLA